MTINCIIIEDEKPAMELMVDNISKIPFLNLIGCCKNTFVANELMLTSKVDLVFSDIEMPNVTGMEFLKTLRNPPLIILTTAYEQYALEGYELEVVDYLLKPFSFSRFLSAVNKAQRQFIYRHGLINEDSEDDYIFVYAEYKEIKINISDIRYIEGLKDYVKIFLEDKDRPVLTRLNLKATEAKLPASGFCRVHNSYIINMNKITSTQKASVYLGGQKIPIGPAYLNDFITKYKH